jgi:DNA repair protein RadC
LSSVELLALLLSTGGGRGQSALTVAQALLAGLDQADVPKGADAVGRTGAACAEERAAPPAAEPSLAALGRASVIDLAGRPGVGVAKAARIVAAVELGRRVGRAHIERASVRSPADVAAMFGERLRHLDREHFLALLLDTKNRLLGTEVVSIGSLDSSLVHPRELYKAAVRRSASAVILVHNHPSGDPSPSAADVACTGRLAEAGKVLGIEVLDHVIIGDGSYVSCRERGIGGLSAGVQ